MVVSEKAKVSAWVGGVRPRRFTRMGSVSSFNKSSSFSHVLKRPTTSATLVIKHALPAALSLLISVSSALPAEGAQGREEHSADRPRE